METLRSLSDPEKKLSIEIVVTKGGGGHYATYHAIKAIVEQQQLPWQLRVTDLDDILVTDGHQLYNWILKSSWIWIWPLVLGLYKLLARLGHNGNVRLFEQYWRERQPDLVISTVTVSNKGLWEGLHRAKPGTPYVTLLIDFADYPPGFWMEPETDSYVVCATEKAVEQAGSLGVKEERIIKSSGMVIHPRFYEPLECDRRAERQRLGLEPDRLTGLVMFGGNGSKVMLDIAERLERFHEKLQLIFLCGRNEELAVALRERKSPQKRFVTTFTKNVPYYMHLADFFIGKPGPGSISEALVMKLPVIVECNFATLVHERYNAEWVREKDVGLVLSSFRNIAPAVEEFLDPETFARYRANVAAIDNRAVFEIPETLQKILATCYQTKATELIQPR